ncbi:hypothetical protein J6590_085784, partial [Homalodisca vitripennis]
FYIELFGNSKDTTVLHNILRSAGLYCTIYKPTRGLACIDNIATNLTPSSYLNEVLDWPISDHKFMSIKLLANSNLCTNDVQNQKVLPIKHRPLPLGALADLKRCLDTLDWVIKMESGASSSTHAAPDADNLNKFFTAGVEEVRRSIHPTKTSAIDLIQTQISCTNREFPMEYRQP